MENRKVIIENMTNSRVGIDIPELRLMRIWEKKGVKKPVDFDILKEAIYNMIIALILFKPLSVLAEIINKSKDSYYLL